MHWVFLLPCVIAITIIGTLLASEKFQGGKTLAWIYSAGYVFSILAAVLAADVFAQSIWYAYVAPEPNDALMARIASLTDRLSASETENAQLKSTVTSLNDELNKETLALRPAPRAACWDNGADGVFIVPRFMTGQDWRSHPKFLTLNEDSPENLFFPPDSCTVDVDTVERCIYFRGAKFCW